MSIDDDDDDDPRTRAVSIEPTPSTFSYNDALLTGKMTKEELAIVRAEILGDLIHAEAAADDAPTLLRAGSTSAVEAIQERLQSHDFAGAVELAERMLER